MAGPERLGRYRLEDVIGVGSFATVHRAVDDALEDTVALKVLAENHSLNPEVRERFIAEGRSLRRISSPHVVTVHDIGESERQQPFLVLEHADRGTLADRVQELRHRGWTATPADVLVTAREVAAAIEAVHEAQLVHRDLSPGNLLLTTAPAVGLHRARRTDSGDDARADGSVVRPDERLIVADLGMCKDLALNSGLTVAAGTSGFRPPEQSGGAAVVDTRADLWALSAMLTWMCEGTDLPDELTHALRRSMADDPDDRHPDVASWLADIEAALQPPAQPPPEPPTASATSADATATSAVAPPPRRWRTRALVVALLAAVAFGGVIGGVAGSRWLATPASQTSTASLTIDGPDRVTLGEEATFTATTTGLDNWVWTLPSGRHILDEEAITITARTPGSAELVLRGRDADGTHLEVTHRLTVTG